MKKAEPLTFFFVCLFFSAKVRNFTNATKEGKASKKGID